MHKISEKKKKKQDHLYEVSMTVVLLTFAQRRSRDFEFQALVTVALLQSAGHFRSEILILVEISEQNVEVLAIWEKTSIIHGFLAKYLSSDVDAHHADPSEQLCYGS